MGKNPRNAVSVPALSGGVNLADALNLVDDNQMTDCKNVWYKDGFLQTRPGIQKTNQDLTEIVSSSKTLIPQYIKNSVYIDDVEYKGMYVISDEPVTVDSVDITMSMVTIDLFSVTSATEENPTSVVNKRFEIHEKDFYGSNKDFRLSFNGLAFYNDKPTIKRTNTDATGKIISTETGKGLYAFASFSGDYVFLFELAEVVTVDENGNESKEDRFLFVYPTEIYAPAVYLNGKSKEFSSLSASVQSAYAPATLFEGYNAITNAYSAFYFTTDSRGNSFLMPTDFNNCYIQVEYTDPRTGKTHKSREFKVENKVANFT